MIMYRTALKALFFAERSNKYHIRQRVMLGSLSTHQETRSLEFPFMTSQFFSSGLIMVGETVREALVLTIGRDL